MTRMIEDLWIFEKACVKVYMWMQVVAGYLNYAGIHSARPLLRHYSFPTSSNCFHRQRRRRTADWTDVRMRARTYPYVSVYVFACT